VQFGVTLARTLGQRNLGPVLAGGKPPKSVWFPVSRPPAGTRVRFGRVARTGAAA